jgi:opacity protein-like surface antigen
MDVLRPPTRLRRALAALAIAVSVLSAAASPAGAQQAAPSARGRFVLGIGGGYAATKSDCSNCGSGEEEAPGEDGATYDDVAFVSIAPMWRLNPKVLAGVEVQAESSRENARSLYVMGTVRFHPWAAQGFFLSAGIGLVQVKSELLLPDGTDGTGTYRGVGFAYGVGWELLKQKQVSFAPYGSHYVSTLGSVTVGDFTGVNVIGNVWVAGIRVFFN